MKKLLALVLVLGIASLANAGLDLATVAGLSYSVSGNTITVSSTLPVTGYVLNLQADNASDLSGAVVPATFNSVASAGGWYAPVWTGASGVATTDVVGTIFSINFTPGAKSIDFVYSSLMGSSNATIGGQVVTLDGLTMTIIPEPMTLTLLGLGGLFLARRK